MKIAAYLCGSVLMMTLIGCGNKIISAEHAAAGVEEAPAAPANRTVIDCRKHLSFQENRIKIAGMSIPISTSDNQIVKIGDAEIAPEEIKEVSEKLARADERQFASCQNLNRAKKLSADQVKEYVKASDELYKTVLSRVLEPASKAPAAKAPARKAPAKKGMVKK